MEFAGCFLKFGKLENMAEFYKRGIMYCNPINYFTKIEDGLLRGDDLENVTHLRYFESGNIAFVPVGEKPTKDSLTMPFRDAKMMDRIVEPFGSVFCLYAINLLFKPFGEQFTITEKVKEFGDTFVLIHNTIEFLKRVKKAVDKRKLVSNGDMVEYIDFSKYSGEKSVFQKDIQFAYQQEWRLFIRNKRDKPLKITIGSIEDISIIVPTERIENLRIMGKHKDDGTITILTNIIKQDV
jgi:hypothetical protein